MSLIKCGDDNILVVANDGDLNDITIYDQQTQQIVYKLLLLPDQYVSKIYLSNDGCYLYYRLNHGELFMFRILTQTQRYVALVKKNIFSHINFNLYADSRILLFHLLV